MVKTVKKNSGFSLLEIVVAMAILVIFIVAVLALVMVNFSSWQRSQEILKAENLNNEAGEALRAVKERAWNEIVYRQSAVSHAGGFWQLAGEGTSEQVDGFTRTISFSPIYRDSNLAIVSASSPGAYLDVLCQMFNSDVAWSPSPGGTISRQRSGLISPWSAQEWRQSDWSVSSGAAEWTGDGRYNSQDGNIEAAASSELTLLEIATSTYAGSGNLESSAFDTGKNSSFIALAWQETVPGGCAGCSVKLRIQTAPDNGGLPGAWTGEWCGPEGIDGDEDDYYTVATGELIPKDHNGQAWIKYRATLSGDTTATPILNSLIIYYQ